MTGAALDPVALADIRLRALDLAIRCTRSPELNPAVVDALARRFVAFALGGDCGTCAGATGAQAALVDLRGQVDRLSADLERAEARRLVA